MHGHRDSHQTVIRDAAVIDGTGAPRFAGDVAIDDGHISAIARPRTLPAREIIDAGGCVLSPGFIDVHTHDDNAAIARPEMTPKLSQGVTTVVAGNCGASLAPLITDAPPPPLNLLGPAAAFHHDTVAAYAEAVNAACPATNLCLLVGHGTLRLDAMTDLNDRASASEIDRMRVRLDSALAEGAIGLSTGLYYRIAGAADIDEVVALAELLAVHGGLYTTHMRDEHDLIRESLDETFTTARRAHVPVVISHHKCAGPRNWGRSAETLAAIDAASRDQEVGFDVYPYVAGSTVLEPFLVDEEIRITVTWSTPHPEMEGRDLADIAADWGIDQRAAAERLKPAGAVYFNMAERDVRRILAHPRSMIGSDGLPEDAHPHPRLWGTFPRVLGHYCRDAGLFDLETAVHKMTGLAAATFGLAGRGVIRPGAAADLVIFRPEAVIDRASFETPKQPAGGIERVMVAGVTEWQDGASTGARAGRFLPRAEAFASGTEA